MSRHQQAPLRRFERMSRLKDYTVEKGLTDPRGWKVVDGAGQTVGQVRDLVIDTDRMAATHLEVELDSRSFSHDDPVILVPMVRAERDGDHNRLVVRDLTRSRITALFDARAAHEATFWDEWWREPATAPAAARDPYETHPRPVASLSDRPDAAPREVTGAPATTRLESERIAARDLDDARQGLPADPAPEYGRREDIIEPDPLEDPHYRRAPDPGERRRFDE